MVTVTKYVSVGQLSRGLMEGWLRLYPTCTTIIAPLTMQKPETPPEIALLKQLCE